MPGLVLVYTGNGKGKTTAALGLSLRALGHGRRVGFLQFMKGSQDYGEVKIAAALPGFVLEQTGRDSFVNPEDPDPVDVAMAKEGLRRGEKWLLEEKFDLVVFDEILVAAGFGLLSAAEILEVLAKRPPETDLVLTGRYAPEAIIEAADTVTMMEEIRHAYQRGVTAKAGMEF
ncbi:Cob(I)yrinic acid a,c-diamide adenosyltransferase [Peptococcaceae bacterium CEB3]|nr:Cob(I)yrinic acid a,c-diamide adenosyltransferase [Peptococcaceae bacterium CEB3]